MGDISTWNPVDNSNTTAPPDGWPEGMAPSAVNNSARAMMGAVRRWYDTVTTQLAGFLPLTGGSLSGTVSAPQYNLNGIAFANNDGTSTHLYDATGAIAVHLQATGSVYDAESHLFRNNAGSVNLGSIAPAGIDVYGQYVWVHNVNSPRLTLSNTTDGTHVGVSNSNSRLQFDRMDASGAISAILGYFDASNNFTVAASITSPGTIQAAQLTSTGNINAAGTVTGTSFIGNVSVPAGGTLSTTGTVTGGQVTSTADINAGTDITAGNNIHAANKIFAQSLEIDVDAYLGTATINNGLQVTNGTCWNQSGSWTSLSDVGLKDDIAPYRRGLDAVLALNPVSFRYRPEVFGDESARIMQFGLVANEVAPLVPEMVGETMLGDRAVSTLTPGHLAFVLINACKELSAQNAALAARIEALEGNHV